MTPTLSNSMSSARSPLIPAAGSKIEVDKLPEKTINLNLLALSAPGDKKDGFAESLVNNFYNSVKFLKTLKYRDPLPFNRDNCKIKIDTKISKYSACDADLTPS